MKSQMPSAIEMPPKNKVKFQKYLKCLNAFEKRRLEVEFFNLRQEFNIHKNE